MNRVMRKHVTHSVGGANDLPPPVCSTGHFVHGCEVVGWHHVDAEVAAILRVINELEDDEAADRDVIVRARDRLRRCAADLLEMSDPVQNPRIDEALRHVLSPRPSSLGVRTATSLPSSWPDASCSTPLADSYTSSPVLSASTSTYPASGRAQHSQRSFEEVAAQTSHTHGAALASLVGRFVARSRELLSRVTARRKPAAELAAQSISSSLPRNAPGARLQEALARAERFAENDVT